jgi:protein-L-isoaspartate O-methyltransferase
MKTSLSTFFSHKLPAFAALWRARHLFLHEQSYLRQSGYLRSLRNNTPLGPDGAPLAFINYPVLALLRERLRPELRVLEFGSGYSTAFFRSLVESVTSVEHDNTWLGRVKELTAEAGGGVTLCHCKLGPDYVTAAARQEGLFHIILIDGRMRHECALASLSSLAPDGVLIWDDSSRERYQKGIEEVKAHGFRVLRLEGLKPAGIGIDETAIFYREGNCLGL